MAASATISAAGRITGEPGGQHSIGPLFFASAAANYSVQSIALANGANTITVPSAPATSGVIIVLPTDNTALVTLKGVSGDTGLPIGKVGWAVLTWDSANAPSSFVINSASAQTGKYTQIIFF
jgi:hypothetical protein